MVRLESGLEAELLAEEVQEQVVVEEVQVQELEEVEALGLVVVVLGLEVGLEEGLELEEGVVLWSACP